MESPMPIHCVSMVRFPARSRQGTAFDSVLYLLTGLASEREPDLNNKLINWIWKQLVPTSKHYQPFWELNHRNIAIVKQQHVILSKISLFYCLCVQPYLLCRSSMAYIFLAFKMWFYINWRNAIGTSEVHVIIQ